MLLVGISFIGGLGVAASVSSSLSMAASLTLLPALLGFVGRRVDTLKSPA